jgi:hypothetical protein
MPNNGKTLKERNMNGWTNWETWNIVTWIDNDESLNRIMRQSARGNYKQFLSILSQFGITKTPDGVSYTDPKVNQQEINNAYTEEFNTNQNLSHV